uniref:Uncharacterized protein n=1 Tax=Arundo donax TaxID=35708 RepID=A0A0A9H2F3_ARUDO
MCAFWHISSNSVLLFMTISFSLLVFSFVSLSTSASIFSIISRERTPCDVIPSSGNMRMLITLLNCLFSFSGESIRFQS